MPFKDASIAWERLKRNPAPLTTEEIQGLFPYIEQFAESEARHLWVHLAIVAMQAIDENKRAIDRFNDSSTRLATRIYWLTWALVILTVAMTILTALLWWKA